MSQQANKQLSGVDMFWMILRRWKVIAAFSIAAALLGSVCAQLAYSPQYTAQASLLVTSRGSEVTLYKIRELVYGSQMDEAIRVESGGLINADRTVSSVSDTSMVELTVKADTQWAAFRVAQIIIDNLAPLGLEAWESAVVEVIEAPTVPETASNTSQAASTSVVAFLLAGVMSIVYFVASISGKNVQEVAIQSEGQARQQIQAPLLAMVSHGFVTGEKGSGKNNGLIISNPHCSTAFVEAYRALALRVMCAMDRLSAQVVMVTSSVSGEGTSTAAANLAMALTQEDKSVLLVDLNVRKPSLYKLFHLDEEKTVDLEELVYNGARPEEYAIGSRQSGLYGIFNRAVPRDMDGMFGSSELERVIHAWRAKVDYILIDAGTVTAVPDVEDIARGSDVSLLMVRNDRVSAGVVNRVLQRLTEADAPALGYVYNDVSSHAAVVK